MCFTARRSLMTHVLSTRLPSNVLDAYPPNFMLLCQMGMIRMNMLKRYTRAFITALRMTAAGKALQPATIRYPNLTQWIQDGLLLTDNTLKTADVYGLDEKTRQQMTLLIDRRPISMDVILRAVKHNLSLEYPMLLDSHMEHNL